MPESMEFSRERRSHPYFFLVAVLVAGILIFPFITPLVLSVITAYIINPIVKRFEVYTRSYDIALVILLIIIEIPIIFAIIYMATNATILFQDITGFGDILKSAIQGVSDTISRIGFGTYAGYFVSAQDITSKTTAFAITLASDFFKSIPFFLLEFVIYLYATYHFMRNGSKIIEFITSYAKTLPAEDEHFFSSIMRGLNRGFNVLFFSYITMSIILACFSYVGYSIFGAPYAFLLAVLTGLFGFLPLFGVWMVYVPVAAFMYFQGNIFSAAGIMIFGVLVLTIFVPLILQPYLGEKKTGVGALTILLGFFSGPVLFGAKGIILGPILLVITETLIVEYMRYRISGNVDID